MLNLLTLAKAYDGVKQGSPRGGNGIFLNPAIPRQAEVESTRVRDPRQGRQKGRFQFVLDISAAHKYRKRMDKEG